MSGMPAWCAAHSTSSDESNAAGCASSTLASAPNWYLTPIWSVAAFMKRSSFTLDASKSLGL
jgi:hypothetical protein